MQPLTPASVRTTTEMASELATDEWVQRPVGHRIIRDILASYDVTRSQALSLKDAPFGAKGDGVSDDTPAIAAWQAAIPGKTGVIPGGTYLCSSELALSVARTQILALGEVIFIFTEPTNGLHISAREIVIRGFVRLRAGNAGCLKALLADGDATYVSLYDVHAEGAARCGWTVGWDLTNAQNFSAFGGHVHGNTGNGIPQLFIVRDTSRAVSFFGVNGTGHANGTTTTEGLRVENGGEIAVHGGAIQGGFATAGINVDGNGFGPQVNCHAVHVEQTAGAGVGYRYNNSTGHMAIYGADGGSVSIGPAAAAYDFEIDGGVFTKITVGAFARNAKINPAQVHGSISETAGHSGTLIGQHRIVGGVIPTAARAYRTRLREHALSFAGTVSTDCSLGSYLTLTIASNAAITIANPTNAQDGQEIQYDIFNNCSGAMGVITWGSEFKLDGALTNPVNGHHRIIRFYRASSGVWREVHRSPADQPN
jgi:hypothetical protein